MERTAGPEEPISPELVLVDGDLAVRAREASPDPPWLLPAVAEAEQRERVTPAAAVVEAPAPEVPPPPPRPSLSQHISGTVVFDLVLLGLVAGTALVLELVPGSAKPTLVPTRGEPAVPTAPATSTAKPAPKPPRVQRTVKPKAVPKTNPPTTIKPKRRPPHASASKRTAEPRAPAPAKVERVFRWRVYPGAVYYQFHLQRGAKTIYAARTLKRTTALPARLKLKPGTYHVLVRPAIPSDTGIILGPAILAKTLTV